ncbi:MAG: hypothetical protein IT580_15340 [Verrucomicrobiales bacterium]|nr:hypothetical protein [Verrucomicrobiales bacterium]
MGTLESPLPPAGGAIFVKDGQLTVQGSMLSSNLCDGGTAPDPKVDATGGAIAVQNTRTQIRDSRFLSNEALGGVVAIPFAYGRGRASGGAFAATNGYLSILRCEFIQNRATLPQLSFLDPLGPGDAQGGAIAHFGQVPLLLEDCLLHGNQIVGSSGGRNGGSGSVRGGALYVQAGSLHGRRLTLTSNRAEGGGGSLARGGQALGGALFAGGKVLLEATDFAENEAVAGAGCSCGLQGIPANGDGFGGGAYFSATANLVQCSFQHNRALGPNSSHPNVVPLPGRSQGGAVYATAAMVIVNTTFLANLALPQRSVGGSVDLEGTAGGAALYSLGLDTRLGAVTVASNLAPSAIATSTGAICFATPAATPRVLASILTGGVPNSISGTFLDLGWNLSDEAQPGFTDSSSRASLAAGLGVPTRVRRAGVVLPLLPGSPALDAIPGLGASDLDQRGYPRPTGPRADIGAYETVPIPPLSVSAPGVVAGRFVLSPDVRYSVEHSADLQLWSPLTVTTSDLDGVVTFVADSEPWTTQHYFRVVPAPPGLSPSNVP